MKIGDRVLFKKSVTHETLEDSGIGEDYVSPRLGEIVDTPCEVQFPRYRRPWCCLDLVEPALDVGTKVRLSPSATQKALAAVGLGHFTPEEFGIKQIAGYTRHGSYNIAGYSVPPYLLEEVK